MLRLAVLLIFALLSHAAIAAETREPKAPPNFVIIFADDLGWGDLACFGHPTIHTPNLDRMAAEGMKFTQFYSAASVCTPSRAALMTGRLPIRNGMCSNERRVLFPNSGGGLPPEEITLARALKDAGYATACFGKWHLGHLPQFLPTSHGFDTYFGIPYSNDMDKTADAPKGRKVFEDPDYHHFNVPLMQDKQIVERPADQNTITRRYTEKAVEFIRKHKEEPFFVYLPHNLPHVPLFRSEKFEGASARGLYGDVIEEIDWSVGEVLDTLRDEGLAENTLVWFTSDNGPWLTFDLQGGSAGPLRDGKGCTWDGGMREPTLAWWPGKIEGGKVVHGLGSTLDIFPTCVTLAGGKVPSDRVMDGYDLGRLLFGASASPRDTMFYYRGQDLMAVRMGPWKAHFVTQGAYGEDAKNRERHDPPLLFQIEHDPGEQYPVDPKKHKEVLAKIDRIVAAHRETLVVPPSQLEIPLPTDEPQRDKPEEARD